MECEAFIEYLKQWEAGTPLDKRLEDSSNIHPPEINDHLDKCDLCFQKLLHALSKAPKPKPLHLPDVIEAFWPSNINNQEF